MKTKMELLTYDEYLKYKHLYRSIMKKDVFENYQKRDKAPIKFFKTRIGFDIVYFEITKRFISIINVDIYKKSFSRVKNFFTNVLNLNILNGYFLYEPLNRTKVGTYEDYIDTTFSKNEFINKYNKYMNEFSVADIYRYNKKDKLYENDNYVYEEMIERDKHYIICNEQRVIYTIVDKNTIFLSTIVYSRMEKENLMAYIEGIKHLSNLYENIYAFAIKESEEELFYLKNDFIKNREVHAYTF